MKEASLPMCNYGTPIYMNMGSSRIQGSPTSKCLKFLDCNSIPWTVMYKDLTDQYFFLSSDD